MKEPTADQLDAALGIVTVAGLTLLVVGFLACLLFRQEATIYLGGVLLGIGAIAVKCLQEEQ